MFPHQAQTIEPLNHIRITQSLQGVALPLVFGTTRVPGLLFWNGDFVASKHNPSGGKGFGGKGGALYTYVGSWQSALCQGPIGGVKSVWDNEGQYVPQGQSATFVIPPPTPATPSLSQVTSGALAATTYFVRVVYTNSGGVESSASPEASLAVLVNNVLVVTSPAAATSATGWNVYVSTTSGTETLQNASPIAIGTNWQEPNSGLINTGNPVGNPGPGGGGGIGGGPRGPFPAFQFAADHGISFGGSPYRRIFYDYLGGAPVPTLSTGQYAVDNLGNYQFANADAGTSVSVTNSFFYNNLITQEVHVIPASTPFTFTGNQGGRASNNTPIFTADFGARYQSTGTALVKVGGSPAAGQYSVSISNGVGTYTFNSADASKAIIINYEWYNFHDDKYAPRTLSATFFPGVLGQASWSYLAGAHPDQVVPYSQTAYAAFQKAYLGMSAAIPVHSYEIIGFNAVGGGTLDASPVDALKTLLVDQFVGIGYPLANVDNNTWFSNTNSAQNWCKALALFISDALLNQQTCASVGARWLEAFQIASFFSEGLLKLVPFGDQNFTGTLATYTANTTVVANLTDNDFIPPGKGKDPITTTRSPYADAYNRVQVNYQNRFNSYNEDFVYEQDEASVSLFGLRIEGPVTYSFITQPTTAAAVANMRLKRSVQIRNKYQFRLSLRYEYLEPMDLITITDSRVGISNQTVRIISVENDVKKGLTIQAEDFPGNGYAMPVVNPKWSTPPAHPPHGTDSAVSTNALIVEATNKTQNAEPTSLYIFCNGGSPNWGGCTVWVSLDGTNYSNIGTVVQPARVGQLIASLPSVAANPLGSFFLTTDTTNTLSIDVSSGASDQNQIGISAWSAVTGYVKGNLATYDGFLWASMNSHTNSIPTISNSNWQIISGVGPAGGIIFSGVTPANAQNLGTLSAVISTGSAIEFLSYQNVAAGTQANQYNLTTLYRGAYGTTISSFPIGSLFVRFKDASIVYQLPAGYLGKTIYFRFTGVNALGGSTQSVANEPTLAFTLSTSGNGAAKFGWTNLDDIPDGNSFGRPPVSQYGKQTPLGKITGYELSTNPDFEFGTTNWNIYDNNASGSITFSLVADSASPNGMGTKLKITELKVGAGPTPGLGGFSYGTGGGGMSVDGGTIQADAFHVGDTYVIDLLANIPVGYTLNFASNSLGTGGSFAWLNGISFGVPSSPPVGTGTWQHYLSRVIAGSSPSANAFPYFYLTGPDGVTWYIAHMQIIDINQHPRRGGGRRHVGGDGTKFGHAIGISSVGIGTLMHGGFHRTFLNSTPQYGFFGSPTAQSSSYGYQFDLFTRAGHSALSDINSNNTILLNNNTLTGGRTYGTVGSNTSGQGVITDESAGALRTILNSSPQWGFFGTPSAPTSTALQIFTGKARVTNNAATNSPDWEMEDTNTGGRNFALDSGGGPGPGFMHIKDNTGGGARTYLNSTPQWGYFGTPDASFPGASLEVFNTVQGEGAIKTSAPGGNGIAFNDTSVNGKVWGANSGVNTAGHWEITQPGTALRCQMNNTPQWGFGGAPNTGVQSFFGSPVSQQNDSTVNNSPAFEVADTHTGGRTFWTNTGGYNTLGGYGFADRTANTGRTYLTSTPQWGMFGTPGVPLDLTAGSEQAFRAIGAAPGISMNDTNTSGVVFGISNGISSAGGVGKFSINQTGTAVRTVMNTTPQWGMFTTPAVDLDLGGQNFRAISSAGQVNLQAKFSGTNGRGYALTSGGSSAAQYNLVDVTAGANRHVMDSSGNYDFAASASPTGLSAGGTQFADLSANLNLKNKNDAAGSTLSPSTTSGTYSVIAEMTLTFTTKGNKVLIIFESAVTMNSTGTQLSGNLALFRDGTQITSDYLITITQTGTQNYVFMVAIGFIDSPSAASHTYDARFKTGVGAPTVVCFGSARRLQAVELG